MNNEVLITNPELKARGWTDSVVRKYLGKPDGYRDNPRYRSAPKTKLYNLSRVAEMERRPEVLEALQKAAIRSETSRKSAKMQSKRLLEYIRNLNIEVPSMPEDVLIEKACSHYNGLWIGRGDYDRYASPLSPKHFLSRISVNFLRHEMTNYEDELARIFGKVGCVKGRVLLKSRILDKIGEVYPTLSKECRKQKCIQHN